MVVQLRAILMAMDMKFGGNYLIDNSYCEEKSEDTFRPKLSDFRNLCHIL